MGNRMGRPSTGRVPLVENDYFGSGVVTSVPAGGVNSKVEAG
jgi:hypothetical protein